MSGGVDSSVAAILLKEKGYEPIGVTMQLFTDSGSNIDNNQDAENVCKLLGIPHITYELKQEFKCRVIDNFIQEYSNQRTPNPCIECNKFMKFGAMYEKAKDLGCDYIATGHYAKTEFSKEHDRYVLKKSNNIKKDQSYVLYGIPKELLKNIIFPLGEFTSKEEVRNIAKEKGLRIADKADSEDICFIPNGNYKEFLENNSDLKPTKGNIVNSKGEILGTHNGLYNYTIGQRKGLGIAYKAPLFVIGFNKEKNELIVGEEAETFRKECCVKDINLLLMNELKDTMKVNVKTRYSSREESATIQMESNNLIKVVFDNPVQRLTPGQSAVFYMDDIVVGGGKIK